MRALLLVLLFAIFFPLRANAEEIIDWKSNIEGAWEINYPKTTELALQGLQKKHAQELAMMPIASPSIKFTDKTVTFGYFKETKNYQFKSFDSKSGRIELLIENEGRESTLNFDAEDVNTLILDLPATVLGPLQIVYSKKKAIVEGLLDSPLANLIGDWQLEEDLTRSMWKELISEEFLETYSSFAANELLKTIHISYQHILFSDQTFEPWEIKVVDGSKILFQSTHFAQSYLEVNKISDELIQIADSQNRLFAVYSRGGVEKEEAAVVTEYPENNVANSFMAWYSVSTKPATVKKKRVSNIGTDGDVEILEIDVDRRQNSGAVPEADLINMSIDLMLRSKFRPKFSKGGYLIDLKKLEDVRDNRGKLLSTERRRGSIEHLNHPTRSRTTHGGSAYSFSMRFDAPELGATELERIAGEVELTGYEARLIRFKNVGQQQGKPLKNPLLEGMDVRPEIRNGQYPEFALKLNQKDGAKILNWYLVTAKGEKLRSGSQGRGGGEATQGFSSRIPDDVTLVIEAMLTTSKETMPFEFKNIKLR